MTTRRENRGDSGEYQEDLRRDYNQLKKASKKLKRSDQMKQERKRRKFVKIDEEQE